MCDKTLQSATHMALKAETLKHNEKRGEEIFDYAQTEPNVIEGAGKLTDVRDAQ